MNVNESDDGLTSRPDVVNLEENMSPPKSEQENHHRLATRPEMGENQSALSENERNNRLASSSDVRNVGNVNESAFPQSEKEKDVGKVNVPG